MNDYVASDIHGNAERLKALVAVLDKKHPNKNYVLHILGDLFDRGLESEEVLSLIFERYKNIHVLKGNHEDLFMSFMEYPKQEYYAWQMNYANPTIYSFALKHLQVWGGEYGSLSTKSLKDKYLGKYAEVERLLSLKFKNFYGRHTPEIYIDQLKNTSSMRDPKPAGAYIKKEIKGCFKNKNSEQLYYLERLIYLHIIQDFCCVYDFFESLESCSLVGDKFLLVHSGYVSRNQNPNVADMVSDQGYNQCLSVKDLQFQAEHPLLWSRRVDIKTGKPLAPDERFDDRIVVFGHTVTNLMGNKDSLDPLFTYDKSGKLASVGLDGLNCDKENGRLNCVCLDDLSQILIKGSKESSVFNRLKVIHKSYSQPALGTKQMQ